MTTPYFRARKKLCLSLVDHCHDKAIEQLTPHQAARWIVLMDALLWATDLDGDFDLSSCTKEPGA